ncbi:MAG: hypothetical protein H6615_10425 [Ignavibacteria bacterium]|nr:hypothetical protein [Ignavibacteria bacterium]
MNFIKYNILLILLWGIVIDITYAQAPSLKSELALIENIKKWCRVEYGMDLSNNFYSKWSHNDNPFLYLYVSDKDSVAWVYPKINDPSNLLRIKDSLDRIGYHTLLYKTYGTSETLLTKHLLCFPIESILFIVFHEATHQVINKTSKIPYVFEEALCDLVGNYASIEYSRKFLTEDTSKVIKHIQYIEMVGKEINFCINQYQNSNGELDINKLNSIIDNIKNSNVSLFLSERYDYTINNAYLLRYNNYSKHYFLLKDLLIKLGGINNVLNFIRNLPDNELECMRIIHKEI